jgi:PAS domain S-box-containing protein
MNLELRDDTVEKLKERAECCNLSPDELIQQLLGDTFDSPSGQISDELRERALESVASGIAIADVRRPDNPLIYVNRAFETITGYAREEVIGHNCRLLQGEDRDQAALNVVREAIRAGKPCTAKLRNYRKDGSLFWNQLNLSPVYNESGELTHFIGVQVNITKRVEYEHLLREREMMFRELFRSNPLPMWVFDAETYEFLDANKTASVLYGYSNEEFRSMTIFDIRPAGEQARLRAHMKHEREDYRQTSRWLHQHKNGTLVEVEVVSHRLTYDGHDAVLAVAHDMTELNRVTRALQESERNYRLVAELSFDYAFILRVNADGTLTHEWITKSFEHVTGFSPDESERRGGWASLLHPDDLSLTSERLKLMLATGQPSPLDYRIVTKSGEIKHLRGDFQLLRDDDGQVTHIYGTAHDITQQKESEMALRESEERFRRVVESVNDMVYTLDLDERYTGVYGSWIERYGLKPEMFLGKTQSEIESVEGEPHKFANARALQGETVTYEWQTQNAAGTQHFQTTVSPLCDGAGFVTGIVGVGRDITAFKRLEDERLNAEMLHMELEKEREIIALKEQFLSMVTHDFRTPLAVMMTTTSLLQRYHDRMSKNKFVERLEGLVEQINYMTSLLDDVTMVRKSNNGGSPLVLEPIEIAPFCQELVDKQRLASVDSHEFDVQLGQLPGVFYGDKRQLERIFTNLLSNAVKYSPPGSKIGFYARCCNDDLLCIDVCDRGIGIPPEDMEYLYKTFFRARNVQHLQGTGLGLAIVKSGVDAHNGIIDCESALGKGTTFTVRLPVKVVVGHSG